MIFSAISGFSSSVVLKVSLLIAMNSQGSIVITLAERGASSIRLISPTHSPEPSTARITSLPSESER